MAPDQAAPVPAGWYPDPYKSSELRWWDGQNWTDSVHPPVADAPAPVAPEPVAPEPVTPEPAAAEPVIAEPAATEPAAAAYSAPQAADSIPQTVPAYDPPAVPPLIEPVLGPPPTPDTVLPAFPPAQEPQTETSAPPTSESKPDAAHATGLPSRRELRKRTEGESEGPLSAHASAPQQPAPDSAVPPTFDWMVAGSPAAPATTAAAAAPAAPVTQTSTAPSTGVQAEAAAASGPMAVPASSAWAQEPAAVATDPEELYSSTATRKATVSGWFIAVMPLIAGVLAIGAVKGAENYPRYVPEGVEWWMLAGGVVVVLYLVTLLLAVADRRKLDWAGYNHPAHWAWAILTAPVYLLVRTIVVRRETGRNSALLWVWIVLAAVLVGAWFAARTFAPTLIDGYSLPFL